MTRKYTQHTSYLVVISLSLFLLSGCQTLQTAKVSNSEVTTERAKQIRLAKQLEADRAARLSRISAKLQANAYDICNRVKGSFDISCRYPVKLVNSEQINAAADGKTVYISTGIMKFTESDDELALVVGHELAHNILSHSNKKIASTILGAIIDGLILGASGVDTGGAFTQVASKAYSKEYELESDYLGLYLAARAGYDITSAPNFWRRMGIENPGSIVSRYNSTHPSTPERYVAMEKAVNEIQIKKHNELALVPNLIDKEGEKGGEVSEQGEERYALQTNSAYDSRQSAIAAKPRPIRRLTGQWGFEAERVANETFCQNGSALASLESEPDSDHGEIYSIGCGDTQVRMECNWGDCGVVEN